MAERLGTRHLHFAGLDFVLTQSGHWYFLEANDDPAGMLICDELMSGDKTDYFQGTILKALSGNLIEHSGGKGIVLMLPDCFIIDEQNHSANWVEHIGDNASDARVTRTVAEFNALSKHLSERGHSAVILDQYAIGERDTYVKDPLGGKLEIGTLYRRSQRFPATMPGYACVNDVRLRKICGDKLVAYKLLEYSDIRTPSTIIPDDKNFAPLPASGYLIRKSRWGSGSKGVRRYTTSMQSSELQKNQQIQQEWVRPATLNILRQNYYFDIRVYVVNGQVIGAYTRRSAAPAEGFAENSPLSWLTTTGPSISISETVANCSVKIDAECVDRLKNTACRIVQILDEAAGRLDYEQTAKNLPSFYDLHSRDGAPIRPIRLLSRH